MINEKETIRCEAVFNEDYSHRYLWKRVWLKEKPVATVITLNPCFADTILMDTTSFLIVNNVSSFEEFGGVCVVNLFSKLTDKLCFSKNDPKEFNDEESDKFLRKSAEEAGKIILAWGKGACTNKAIGILGLLTIGLGLTPLIVGAAGIAGAVASGNLSKFKNYDAIIDYSEKRVIFLKTRGKAAFVVENDTIEGIDLKEIINKNSEE